MATRSLVAFGVCVLLYIAMAGAAVPASAQALNPANGHWYQIVAVPGGSDWFTANALAESMVLHGVRGHLATITSESENEFIRSLPQVGSSYWAGGYKVTPNPDSAAGWHWVTGEPWSYTNWDQYEPNGGLSNEDGLEWRSDYGRWNDRLRTTSNMPAYVVEFPTPEPSGVLVLLAGAVGLAGFMRRRK